MKIEPTIGRVVWFWPSHGGQHTRHSEQPLKADVVHVNENGTVNLFVVDHTGISHREHNIELVQDGDTAPGNDHYCTWMPYQVGQAKKHAEEEPRDKEDAAGAGVPRRR